MITVLQSGDDISRRSVTENERRRRLDLIGIVSLAVLGLSVLVFLKDPIRYMNPGLPVLSKSDWPGGGLYPGLTLDGGNGEQEFRFRMDSGPHGYYSSNSGGARVIQKTVMFASPTEAAEIWQLGGLPYYYSRAFNDDVQTTPGDYDGLPVEIGAALPTSTIECKNWADGASSCIFWGYSGRWYSEVWMLSTNEKYLDSDQMEHLAARAAELLLKAN